MLQAKTTPNTECSQASLSDRVAPAGIRGEAEAELQSGAAWLWPVKRAAGLEKGLGELSCVAVHAHPNTDVGDHSLHPVRSSNVAEFAAEED